MRTYLTTESKLISTTGYLSNKINIDLNTTLFEYFFNSTDSLTEQNKFLYKFLLNKISENKISEIQNFINDKAIYDLHISLIKTILICVENLEKIDNNKLLINYQG